MSDLGEDYMSLPSSCSLNETKSDSDAASESSDCEEISEENYHASDDDDEICELNISMEIERDDIDVRLNNYATCSTAIKNFERNINETSNDVPLNRCDFNPISSPVDINNDQSVIRNEINIVKEHQTSVDGLNKSKCNDSFMEKTDESEDMSEGGAFSDWSESVDDILSDSEKESEFIYSGSNLTTTSFHNLIVLFSLQHNLSQNARQNLLKLFSAVLPKDNNVLSSSYMLDKATQMYELTRKHHNLCSKCHCVLENNECLNVECQLHGSKLTPHKRYSFYEFDVEEQLKTLVEDKIDVIADYANLTVNKNVFEDISSGKVYSEKARKENTLTLVWHIDGAPTINAKNLSIWLISAFVVEFGPKERYSSRNIVVCGMWYGPLKPDFELFQIFFVKQIKSLMSNGISIETKSGNYSFSVNIQAELADLPAKAASTSMKQFNGKHGCSICYHPGEKLDPRNMVWVYPYQADNHLASIRLPDDVLQHADIAEDTGVCCYGIKARSSVLDIIKIPDELPLDYMHLILEGEIKRKLKYFNTMFLKSSDYDAINKLILQVKYPHDFHKKLDPLNVKNNRFKAGEIQVLLLHVFLPVFQCLPDAVFCHVGLLITAIQILNQPINSISDIELAYRLIRQYQKQNSELYGDASETYTVHALQHLPMQRYMHGAPLVLMSNFVFEGFIAVIKRQFHGSKGIIAQMAKYIGVYQSVHKIANTIISDDPNIIDLKNKLLKKACAEKKQIGLNTFLYGKLSNEVPKNDVSIDISSVNLTEDSIYASQVFKYLENYSLLKTPSSLIL